MQRWMEQVNKVNTECTQQINLESSCTFLLGKVSSIVSKSCSLSFIKPLTSGVH